jgi:MFS transporter, DHA3 family, tetracycline resistance protein
MSILKSLHNRLFFLLWCGQTLSRLGDSIYRVALVWWVLEKTGSAAAVAKILIFSYLPMVLFLLLGGIAIDRFSRSKVMLLSDLARAAVVFIVSLLASGGRLEVWHLYIASGVFGTVNAFFQPAYTVIVPEIVAAEDLTSANSLTNLSKQLADVAGPAIGASVIALAGTSMAFAVDGFSFIISAFCLLPLLRLSVSSVSPRRSTGALKDLREGFQTVLATPWLWITIAVASLANVTLNGPLSVALPFLIKNELHRDVGSLGAIYSMLAFGSVVATVWLGRSGKIRRRGLTFYGALLVAAIMTIVLGLPIPFAGIGVAAFTIGAALTVSMLIWMNTLQEFVSRDVLGRVASIDSLGSYGLIPIGYATTGWAADHLGAPLVFVIGGVITSVLALLALSSRAIRNLD